MHRVQTKLRALGRFGVKGKGGIKLGALLKFLMLHLQTINVGNGDCFQAVILPKGLSEPPSLNAGDNCLICGSKVIAFTRSLKLAHHFGGCDFVRKRQDLSGELLITFVK